MSKASGSGAVQLKRAYDYCREVTRRHAKSFYFAAKFLPAHKQLPVYALYALCRHVDDEVDEAEVRSPQQAVEAVNLWQHRLNEIYQGQPPGIGNKGAPPSDPNSALVLMAWKDLLKTCEISQNLPLELMKGVLMDTQIKRYQTFEDLYVYCYRVASTVGLMSVEILGGEKPETLEFAEALGIAMQLTNILRDVKEDAAMGRIYLPEEDLRKFKVTEAQILESRFDKNFSDLMKFEIERARRYYLRAELGIPLLEKDSRFTVLMATRIYGRILDEIERQKYDVFKRRAYTSARQKFFAIPQIWHQAKRL